LFKLRRGSRRAAEYATDTANDAETTPIPPRFWWLKRLAAAYLIFVTCLALLYWAWTAHSKRQFAAAIADVQARGEPIFPQDFDPPALPDGQNAATLLLEAAQRFKPNENWADALPQKARDSVLNEPAPELGRADLAIVAQVVARQDATLRLIRRARLHCGDADWGLRPRRRLISVMLPHLNPQREMATLLTVAALHHHARGDEREALEICRDLVRQGEFIGRYGPLDIVQVVAHRPTNRAGVVVEQIAPTLKLPDDPTRQTAAVLIAELLDERVEAANWLHTAQMQRAFAIDVFASHIEGQGFFPEPMYRLDAARTLRGREADVAAARCASYQDAIAILPEREPPWEKVDKRTIPRWRQPFGSHYPPRLERGARMLSLIESNRRSIAQSYYLCLLDGRAAAVRLAARLHQLDHAGRMPATWDDLVPKYLPAVPRDPFAPAAAPLRFIRRADGQLIVYSVGRDGVDNGGAEIDARGRPVSRFWGRTSAIDLVCEIRSGAETEQHER
jgi:hypothetical protein